MDIETDAAGGAGAPKPEASVGRLVDEILAVKAETRAQKRALVVSLKQLTRAVRSARRQLEEDL